jgi:hypothetical protein
MKQFYKLGAAAVALGLMMTPSWGQEVTTFDYTGEVQTYVVPAGVSAINIEAYGAEGGTALNDSSSCIIGGWGGYATGDLAVTPGETLYIYVGGRGYAGDIGGWNGGGDACDNPSTCAKGGGASDVRQGGTDLLDRVIVAGGGGGAEWSGCSGGAGDGGGLIGGNGAHPTTGARDGKGGTQVAGGAFGTGGYNGTAGTFGVGGAGGTHPSGHSGSGGGGWYGGGGSAEDGHAGGGSSYIDGVTDGSTTPGLREGNGQIIITELCEALTVTVSAEEVCFGEEVTLDAEGAGAITWDGGVVNGEAFTPPAGVTTYTATSDDDGDCGFEVEITVHELPEVTASADVTEICLGESITLNGGGADTYSWDPADIDDGVAYTPVDAGVMTYTVTGTDGVTSCENEATIEITINALPEVTATASPESVCDGDELTLTGGGATDYDWDMGVDDGVAFTPAIGTATYTVVGTDDNGCENEASIEVTTHELPEVTATADESEVCFGAEVTLTGGGAETYVWDPAEVEDGMPYTTSMAGINTFTVTGTDANGCENTASVDVTVLEEIVVTTTTTDEILGGDGAIDLDVTGGVSPYTFDWDTDETGDFDDLEDLSDLTGGSYTVVVMDDNGCTTTIVIEVNSQLGIGESGMASVSVYPNPTSGQVNITAQGTFTYVVKSVKGDIIVTNTATGSDLIELADVADGIYYITVQMNESVKTFKVVKN